ncbi:5-hydroxytryptamine receptor 1A, partial [Lucilia cuprina]
MAIDRYMCALHPRRYYQHSSKKGCVAILSLTWIISLTIFGFLVLPKGYYFNNTGLMACEPFYSKPSYRILATCAFYFPTTMVLMYCYGSSFHMSRFRLNDPTMPLTAAAHHPAYQHHPLHHYHHHQQHTYPHLHHYHHRGSVGSSAGGGGGVVTTGGGSGGAIHTSVGGSGTGGGANTPSAMMANTPVMNLSMAMSMGLGLNTPANSITKKEKNSSGSTSRSMATISLGFIVMVTPWTIQEIVTACTGSKLPPFLDFLVTWTALSNSFWNPFMYWLLNADFRRLSKQLMALRCNGHEDTPEHKSPCCHINSDFEITTLPMPPEPPTSRPPQNNGSGGGGGGGGGSSNAAAGLVGAGGIGGSVLGICARARSNSLNRSTSFHIRDGGGGGGISSSNGHHTHHQHGYNTSTVRPDIEGLSEKYWGEILERTVSSNSLHAAMQKSFMPTQQHYGQQQPLHHHGHHQQQASGVNNPMMMMTTSFSKQSDLNLHIREHDDNLVDSANTMSTTTTSDLNKFSTSEPKLCEHEYQQQQQHHLQHQHHHDIHCAKTKANTEANKTLGAGGGG